MTRVPVQQELFLPLLRELEENGPMKPADVYEALAERLNLDPEITGETKDFADGSRANVYHRAVRWARQTAVMQGLIPRTPRGVWELSDKGHRTLTKAAPGVVICVGRTDSGVVLWAEALSALNHIEDESAQLIFASTPYPLVEQREYGGWHSDHWIETALKHVNRLRSKLSSNGSMVFNLSDCYNKGMPTLNPYQEELAVEMRRLGFHLIGRDHWHNPAKPRTTPYVTKQRVRMANGVEQLWWWSPSPYPKADNRNVLEPYSTDFLETLARGGEMRGRSTGGAKQSSPGLRYRRDNGGRIPQNIVRCSHEGSGSAYIRHCKTAGLPVHPARMPWQIADRWVRMTTDPGDTVIDWCAGSLTTAAVCERLERRHISVDCILEYLAGGMYRLRGASGLTSYVDQLRRGARVA